MRNSSSRDGSRSKGGSEPSQIEHLQNLAGLLRHETDRWSRQVILAEAVEKLIELEKQLAKKKAAS